MKAVQITETGAPEVLKYVELPTPKPGPGEVLVKAHAIGVCMPETLVRRGVYKWMPPLPLIPGIEMGGTVVEAGPGASKLKIGQKVFVCAREFRERSGCYAEYIAAREDLLYAVPDSVDLDQVAGLANYQVAWHLLNSALQGFQYKSVLVIAAAGGVGTALVQLAKVYGKRVIGVVSSDARGAFARAQGADEVIDRTRTNVIAETQWLTGGRGVHFEHVDMTRFHNSAAMHAFFRHVDRRAAGAVFGLIIQAARENTRRCRFADTAHTG